MLGGEGWASEREEREGDREGTRLRGWKRNQWTKEVFEGRGGKEYLKENEQKLNRRKWEEGNSG